MRRLRHMHQQVPVRGHQDHRAAGGDRERADAPVWSEQLPHIPASGAQDRPGDRHPRAERDRKDDIHRAAVREGDPQLRPVRRPALQGGGAGPAVRDRARGPPREGVRRAGAHGAEAAVCGQASRGRQGRPPRPAGPGGRAHERRRGRHPAGPHRGHRPPARQTIGGRAAAGGHRRHPHEGRRRVLLRRAVVVPRHLPAHTHGEAHTAAGQGEAGGGHRARPGHLGFHGRQRLPGVRLRRSLRCLRSAAPGQDGHQHLPGRLHAGGEHPVPRYGHPLRVAPPAGHRGDGHPHGVRRPGVRLQAVPA